MNIVQIKDADYKKWICIFFSILVTLSFIVEVYKLEEKRISLLNDIDISQCALYGYLQENNRFINTIGDAHIQLPELNAYVEGVTLVFSELQWPINVTLYYAEEDHGYSEDYTVTVVPDTNIKSIYLEVKRYITTCRIDIGNIQGEEFGLQKLTVNNSTCTNQSINLKIFQNFILFLSVFICLLILYSMLIFKDKMNKEHLFAALACGIGVLYLFSITPLSIPDEPHHYHSSYQLSNYLLLQESEYGDSADFDYSQYVGHHNVSSGYNRIISDFGKPATVGEKIPIPEPRALSYFIEYLPQAFGIALCRITNQNLTTTFLTGRLFNLLFYCCCVYFAVKRTPKFKMMFGVVGIMPMALHQAASFSYDGFINGMSLIFLASILKGIYEDGPLSNADYIWILTTGALLAPAKIVYSVFLIFVLLIPVSRFSNRKQWLKGTFLIFFAGFSFILVFQLPTLLSSVNADPNTLNWAGEHNYTIRFILCQPWETIKIFVRTFIGSIWEWISAAIGRSMSGLTLPLPEWISVSYMALLVLSVLGISPYKKEIELAHKIFFILVAFFVIALVMFSMFIGWTSDTSNVVLGVQGRYFIPIIPLLVMVTNNDWLVLQKKMPILVICATVLNLEVVRYVVHYTVSL